MHNVTVLRAALVVAISTVLLSGCAVSGLDLVQDDRVDIIEPGNRSKVSLPVTVAWTVRDFDVGPGKGSFAVFVDRAPQPPRRTVAWMFRNDDFCRPADGCPDAQYLAERSVYLTTDPRFVVDILPERRDNRREFHEVTVVLLDEEGKRVGESAFAVEFEVERDED